MPSCIACGGKFTTSYPCTCPTPCENCEHLEALAQDLDRYKRALERCREQRDGELRAFHTDYTGDFNAPAFFMQIDEWNAEIQTILDTTK